MKRLLLIDAVEFPPEKAARPLSNVENWFGRHFTIFPDVDFHCIAASHKDLETLADSLRAKPVHPTELYSAFNSFLVAAILLAYFSLTPAAGRVFGLMLILEGASRYILEMIRVEPPVLGNMSFSMVLSAGLVAAGIVMWLACRRRTDRVDPSAFAVAR